MAGKRLTFSERTEIARLHEDGAGVRTIARALGRDPSTICRELKLISRGGLPGGART